MKNMLRAIAPKLAYILLIATCHSLLSPGRVATRLVLGDISMRRRASPSILFLSNQPSDKHDEIMNGKLKISTAEEQLQQLEKEHKVTLKKLKQAHSGEKNILEQKIGDLRKKLETSSTKALLEKASRLQNEMRKEIEDLSSKLVDAEARSLKFAEFEKTMTEKQQALEEEIKTLHGEYEEGKEWKAKYEKESALWKKQEEEYLAEIQRLEQEVRVVFSIGRRTSDKLVEELSSQLKDKELNMTTQIKELSEKNQYIDILEEERKSLRKLSWLGVKVTRERALLQLARLRKSIRSKIAGKALPAVEKTSSNSTIPVPKRSRGRSI